MDTLDRMKLLAETSDRLLFIYGISSFIYCIQPPFRDVGPFANLNKQYPTMSRPTKPVNLKVYVYQGG